MPRTGKRVALPRCAGERPPELFRWDLTAEIIFLTVQRLLFRLRDMTAVLAGHGAFLLTHLMVFMVQFRGLRPIQRAVLDVLVDAIVLIGKTMIHLLTSRVVLLPSGIRRCGGGEAGQRYQHSGEAEMFAR